MQSSHDEQAANELQAVRAKIVQLEGEVADVKQKAEADPALKLALLQQLPGLRQELGALRQKEERLAAAEAAAAAAARSGRSAHEAPPDSPRRRLAAWIREHPTPNILLQGPGPEVDCEMRRLLREMPLPPHIYKVFEHHLYTVPAEGLFVAEQPSLVSPSQTQAFERWDLVQLFKERAKSLGRLLVSTLLLYGLRRTGKTFSVPWAQVEAIRHLEGGEGSPAPRCSHVLVVACAQVDQPSLEDYPLLLAAASYLRIPIVFDEFIHKWADLPAALNGFLSSSGAHFEGVALRPLQFVLMDSMQRSVKDVTGSAGSLYRRDNIGVPCAIAVPPPSLQLLAGMLLQYHPDCYPGMLLRAVATNGRYLDRYQVRPTTELQELDLLYLRTHALLQGEHLSAVETAIQMRGHVKLLQVQDQVAQLSQLQSCELFEASPMDDSSLQLVEPQLLTIAQLAKAKARSSHEREAALAVAEGLLLEVLLRTDLTNSLLHCLRLSGKPTLWWGNVGTAELDLVLEFPDGDEPVVWISCKRQHEDQECKPFLEHINQLQGMAKVTKAQSKRRGSESKEGESVAVRLMRAMVAKGVHLVAVSGYSRTVRDAEGLLAFPGKFPATLELEFQGTKHSLPYKRSAFLLHELVEPQCAVPLNTAPRVMRRDVTAAMQQMSAESGLVS